MTIYMEINEARSKVPTVFETLKIPYETTHLKVSDYFVGTIKSDGSYEGVPIERKDAGDFVSSLISGHLHTQCYELSYNFPNSFVVVIGDMIDATFYRKVHHGQVAAGIAGLSLKSAPDGVQGRVNIVMLPDVWWFGYYIKHIDDVLQKGDFVRVPFLQKRKLNPDEILTYVVSSLPNIGTHTADALLRHFGSIKAIINASIDDLCQVHGIGTKKAAEIYSIINMTYNKEAD